MQRRMSGSIQLPMSSKDFHLQTIEIDLKEEIIPKAEDSEEEFIHETETTLIVDEIEIKHEEMDFHLYHNSTADHSDLDLETMSSIAHVECGSTDAEEKNLNDFYQDILLCERNCETCVKYMRILSEHVRTTHAPPQPIHDPVPVPLTDQSSSSIQIKSEVVENIEKMRSSDSNDVSTPRSDSDPDCNIESDLSASESEQNDPDYGPGPSHSLTKGPHRQGQGSVRNHASSQSRSLKSKKKNLQSQEHFKCGQCDKSFTRMIHLKEHMSVHTGERPFKCDLCEKKFVRSSDLSVHKRFHTGEKPFKCDLCVKGFVRSYDLTLHKRIHTGEKPFKCDVCMKSFSQHAGLTKHKRVHTGDRPFKCEVCEKSFTTSFNLTQHRRTKRNHTGEKPYQCDQCEMSFKLKSHMTTHKKIHTKGKTSMFGEKL